MMNQKVVVIFFLVMLFLFKMPLYSQWELINSGTDEKLTSITFSNDINGVIVGYNGTVLHSTDSGQSWEGIDVGIDSRLLSVMFPSENIGYAVGKDYTVIKTIDSGLSWNSVNSRSEGQLNSVFFVDENIGYVVGDDGLIIKTIDGGLNWNSFDVGTDADLESITFINSNVGFIVGQHNIVLKTDDGGTNWNVVSLPGSNDNYDWSDIYFFESGTGYIQGFGYTYKTIDFGNTWSELDGAPHFIFEEIGYSEYNPNRKTVNSGVDWLLEVNPSDSEIKSMYFFNENHGLMVGYDGSIIKTTNGGGFHFLSHSPIGPDLIYQTNDQIHIEWQSDQLDNFTVDLNLYQEDTLVMNIASGVNTQNGFGEYMWNVPEISSTSVNYRIEIASNDEVLVPIEIDVTLLQEDDIAYYRHDLPSELSDVHVNYMQFYNDKLWFCGSYGTVAYSNDADFEQWTVVNTGIPEDEQLCWMDQVDTDIFIAGSYSGKIFRTINTGESWNLVFNDTTVTNFINYVKAFPETGEIIVQGDGVYDHSPMAFLYSDDFGLTWTNNNDFLLGASNPWKTVFLSINSGYTADSHLVYKTNDLGFSWTESNPSGTGNFIVTSLNFMNDDFGVAGGYNTISITRDGGDSWYVNNQNGSGYISFIDENTIRVGATLKKIDDFGMILSSKEFSHPNYYGRYSFIDSYGNGFICAGASLTATNGWFSSTILPTNSIGDNDEIISNKNLTLFQNYPNPFNPETVIHFSLQKAQGVKIFVYNIKGEKVMELVNRDFNAGIHRVNFDAKNLTSGQYFYKVETSNSVQVKKMLLLK